MRVVLDTNILVRANPKVSPQKLGRDLLLTIVSGPHVLVLSTAPDLDPVRPPITFDPAVIKHSFMNAIGAPRYIPTLFGGGHLERD